MSLLDKYDQMQSRPMGTSTALYRDPATVQAGRDYNRQKEDYGFARRLLRRYAKAGMPDMALKLAELGDKTAAMGVTTRGTLGANERKANVAGRVNSMKQGIRMMENPTGGAGVGVQGATPLSSRIRPEATGGSAADKARQATLAGKFGSGERNRLLAKDKAAGMRTAADAVIGKVADDTDARIKRAGFSGIPAPEGYTTSRRASDSSDKSATSDAGGTADASGAMMDSGFNRNLPDAMGGSQASFTKRLQREGIRRGWWNRK